MNHRAGRYRGKFMECLSMTCTALGIDYARLGRERGIRDFFLDIATIPCAPIEVAARALDVLCERDDSEYDRAILIGVVQFMDETVGSDRLQDGRNERKLADLRNAMLPAAKPTAVAQVLSAWYG